MRGLACILVLIAHQVDSLRPAGGIGVSVFFTLSGFLITALLLKERDQIGRFGLREFYRRRALRLLPAFLTMLFVIGTISLFMAPDLAPTKAVVASVLYYSNWLQAFGPALGGLQHTWSLAIEEQFYLVWPLVLIAASRFGRWWLLLVTASLSLLSLLWRFVLYDMGEPANRLYFGSDTRVDGLLLGCLLAAFLSGRSEGRARPAMASVAAGVTAVSCVGLVAAGILTRFVLMPTLIGLGTVAVIWCVAQGDYRGWLAHRFLRLVGERSYALYLWSLPLASLMDPFDPPVWLSLPVALSLAWGAAALSWRFVETPFLRLNSHPNAAHRRRTGLDRLTATESPA